MLERMESKAMTVAAKTERFKSLRDHYLSQLKRCYASSFTQFTIPSNRKEQTTYKPDSKTVNPQTVPLNTTQQNVPLNINDMILNKEDLMERYLESLSNHKLQDILESSSPFPATKQSSLSNSNDTWKKVNSKLMLTC